MDHFKTHCMVSRSISNYFTFRRYNNRCFHNTKGKHIGRLGTDGMPPLALSKKKNIPLKITDRDWRYSTKKKNLFFSKVISKFVLR